MAGVIVRPARRDDLATVREIQAVCPEASQWNPEDYLAHHFLIACCADSVVGFAVARSVGQTHGLPRAEHASAPLQAEAEILNLAVAPAWRRRGVGRALIGAIWESLAGDVYLEVRESNEGARRFYETLGFQAVGLRPEYYHDPLETAIVMKFHSC